jgi:hypothetical protein
MERYLSTFWIRKYETGSRAAEKTKGSIADSLAAYPYMGELRDAGGFPSLRTHFSCCRRIRKAIWQRSCSNSARNNGVRGSVQSSYDLGNLNDIRSGTQILIDRLLHISAFILHASMQDSECAYIRPLLEQLLPSSPVFYECWPVAGMLDQPVGSVSLER